MYLSEDWPCKVAEAESVLPSLLPAAVPSMADASIRPAVDSRACASTAWPKTPAITTVARTWLTAFAKCLNAGT